MDINATYDFDRDCPGNPSRLPGCRCPMHRPDLYHNATATIPTCFAGFTVPNTTGTMTWPIGGTTSPVLAYPVTVWPQR